MARRCGAKLAEVCSVQYRVPKEQIVDCLHERSTERHTMPTLPAISPRGNAAASSNRSKKVRASRIASARVLFTEYTAVTCTLHSA
jgi:hypothetical protein